MTKNSLWWLLTTIKIMNSLRKNSEAIIGKAMEALGLVSNIMRMISMYESCIHGLTVYLSIIFVYQVYSGIIRE